MKEAEEKSSKLFTRVYELENKLEDLRSENEKLKIQSNRISVRSNAQQQCLVGGGLSASNIKILSSNILYVYNHTMYSQQIIWAAAMSSTKCTNASCSYGPQPTVLLFSIGKLYK